MTAPLTAGAYLRLRREAAGLTLYDAARLYALSADAVTDAELLLVEAERDQRVLDRPALTRLLACYPFDWTIYENLAVDLPTPSVCRACGCSWYDPCVDPELGSCAWANREETQCTACERRQVAA